MNPDHTIICKGCHRPVVRATDMQNRIIVLEPSDGIYVYSQIGTKIVTERVRKAGLRHQCPAEKGK